MIKRIAGSVLIFEAIAVVLAVPVAINVAGVPSARAWAVGLTLFVASILVAGRLDRPGGVTAGWVIQGLVIASAIIVPIMAILGAMFAALYYGALRMVASVEANQAAGVTDNGAQRETGNS